MFENILPHQIILLWTCIAGLTGTLISFIVCEGKRPMYMIATMFSSAFAGCLFGGFFVALTGALVWHLWSLLIPIFIGGIVSVLVTVYLADKIPTPSIKVKPIALLIAVMMIIILSFAPMLTISTPKRLHASKTTTPIALNLGDVKLLKPASKPDVGHAILENILSRNQNNIITTLSSPSSRLTINSWHTNIEFPTKMCENAEEGDYIGFKLTFSVPSNSPSDWKMPLWYIYIWGDINGNGQMDENDTLLDEWFFKIPSKTGDIYTSAPFWYGASGQPMWAIYGIWTTEGYIVFPVTFAKWTVWKDDRQYDFMNTPEKFIPPYDGASYQTDAEGHITLMEDVEYWVQIKKGEAYSVYGEIYCPYGMTNYTNDWYLVVEAYDYAYSTSDAVATHSMHFVVKSPEESQPPIVNISSSWWIEVAMLLGLAMVSIVIVKYGVKWAFK